MSRKKLLIALFASFTTLSYSTYSEAATVLSVDLQKIADTTESGFEAIEVSDGNTAANNSFSTSTGSVDATISATGTGGRLQGRGTGSGRNAGLTGLSLPDVHRDLVAARDGDGGFQITLTGLTIGHIITLEAWHNDSTANGTGFSTPLGSLVTPSLISGGSLISADTGALTVVNDSSGVDADLDSSVISFTATGSTAVILLDVDTPNNFLPVGGFIVDSVVPEPGSFALLGLGGLLIARRRRD